MGGAVLHASVAELVTCHGAVFTLGHDHPLLRRLSSWRRRRVHHQHLDPLAAWGLCTEVLVACLGTAAPPQDLAGRARSRLLHALADPPSMHALARELGCSREHLSRAFTRRHGESPAAFLQRERLALGRDLLAGTSLAVAEIARRCGYAHPGNFTRALRAVYGCGAAEFRRRR